MLYSSRWDERWACGKLNIASVIECDRISLRQVDDSDFMMWRKKMWKIKKLSLNWISRNVVVRECSRIWWRLKRELCAGLMRKARECWRWKLVCFYECRSRAHPSLTQRKQTNLVEWLMMGIGEWNLLAINPTGECAREFNILLCHTLVKGVSSALREKWDSLHERPHRFFSLLFFIPTRFQVESTHHHRRSRLALITAQNQEFICSVPTNSMDCLSRLLICLVIEIDKYLKIQAESKILDFDSLCAARDWDSIRRGENSIACSAIHHEKIKSEFFSASFARRSTVNSVANLYFPQAKFDERKIPTR